MGERLREARGRSGTSQRALAFPGCSHAYISKIEAGERTPSLHLLGELARRVGVSQEYLAWGSEGRARRATLTEADIELRLDHVEAAEELYREAVNDAASTEERAFALTGLGQTAWRRGEPDATIKLLEEALALLGDRWEEHPEIGDTLGRAYTTVPEMERSIATFERYLASANARRDLLNGVRFSVLLANALVDVGNVGRAAEVLGGALAQVEGRDDPFLLARLYWTQSRLHEAEGDHETAARYARRTIELLEATDHSEYLGRAHQLLAYIELELGRPEEALALARRSRQLMGTGASELELVRTTVVEAGALAELGEHGRAAELAMEASAHLSKTHPVNSARNYALLASIFEQLGDRARALELYELALGLMQGRWSPFLQGVVVQYVELLEQQGRRDEAFEVLKRALGSKTTEAREA